MINSALLGDVRLVLASASPRRRDILRQTMPDATFDVRPSDADENLDKKAYKSDPSLYAVDTARLKAKDIFEKVTKEDQVYTVSSLLFVLFEPQIMFQLEKSDLHLTTTALQGLLQYASKF